MLNVTTCVHRLFKGYLIYLFYIIFIEIVENYAKIVDFDFVLRLKRCMLRLTSVCISLPA